MDRPIEEHPNKGYLGDGAYAMPGSYRGEIVLTTENGINETNRIVLGPEELAALDAWLRSWKFLA